MRSSAVGTDDCLRSHVLTWRALRALGTEEVNQMLKPSAFVHVAADSLRTREEGQTMAEYGVVLAVITALVFGALALLSGNIITALTRVAGLVGVGNG